MNIETMKKRLDLMKKELENWKTKKEETEKQVLLHIGYIQALEDLLKEANNEKEETRDDK